MYSWLTLNWQDLIQNAGIIGGLVFSALSFHRDAQSRRVSNMLTLTGQHRDIWKVVLDHPRLSRVLDPRTDVLKSHVKMEERLFVNLLIQHLYNTFQACKTGQFMQPENLGEDIREFFRLPIPYSVWQQIKKFQDKEFAQFVERHLS